MTHDEMRAVIFRAQRGDEEAKEILYKSFYRTCESLAKNVKAPGLEEGDILAAAFEGLWRGIRKYDVNRQEKLDARKGKLKKASACKPTTFIIKFIRWSIAELRRQALNQSGVGRVQRSKGLKDGKLLVLTDQMAAALKDPDSSVPFDESLDETMLCLISTQLSSVELAVLECQMLASRSYAPKRLGKKLKISENDAGLAQASLKLKLAEFEPRGKPIHYA